MRLATRLLLAFLTTFLALAVFAAVASIGLWIFQAFNGSYHVTLTTTYTGPIDPRLRLGPGLSEMQVAWTSATAYVNIARPARLIYALHVGADAALWTIGLLGLWQFRSVIQAAAREDPFTADNVRRLRYFAGVLFVYQPLRSLVDKGLGAHFLADAGIHGLHVATPSWASMFLAALVVLAIAQAFSAGVNLRADLEGTV